MPKLTPRQLRWGMVFALAPFLAVVMIRWGEPPSSAAGDYAQYLLHAKAIAEGRPYSDIGYIYTDMNLVGPRNQPPGWPLVLAPFVGAFGVHSPVLDVLMVVLVAVFAVLAGFFIARRDDAVSGVLVAAMTPLALGNYDVTSVLSDPFFCVLVWLTLLAADSEKVWDNKRALLVGALLAACLSVRVAGIALLPALLAYVVVRHGRKNLVRLVPLVVLLALIVVLVVVAGDHIPFFGRIRLSERLGPPAIEAFWGSYKDALLTQTLYPFPHDRLNDLYHVLVIPFLAVGAVHTIRKTSNSVLWYFAVMYGVMLFLAPVRDGRYLWPLTPIVAWWLVAGVRVVATRMFPVLMARSNWPLVVPMAAMISGATITETRVPARPSLIGDPDAVQVFDLVRRLHDAGSARVMFINPRVLTLETGVPAMGVPYGTRDRVLNEIRAKRLTHLVLRLDGDLRESERRMLRLVNEEEPQFPEILRNSTYTVRRLVVAPGTSSHPLPVNP